LRNPVNPENPATIKKNTVRTKRDKGLDQLKEYLQSSRIKDRPGLKGVLLVFTGKNKFEITEID
jgi:hypothetical protein